MSKERSQAKEDDVLRRMLNTPPTPHVAPKPKRKPKKSKKADK